MILPVSNATLGNTEWCGVWDAQHSQRRKERLSLSSGGRFLGGRGAPGSGPGRRSIALDYIVYTPSLPARCVSQLKFRTKLSTFLDIFLPSRCGVCS